MNDDTQTIFTKQMLENHNLNLSIKSSYHRFDSSQTQQFTEKNENTGLILINIYRLFWGKFGVPSTKS